MSNEELNLSLNEYSVGCIVGRFQVPELHTSYSELFDFVTSRHKIVVCLLGVAVVSSKKNPLDFKHRKQMIEEKYPNVIVLPISDMRLNSQWSKNLDTILRDGVLNVGQKPLLYGCPDSFINFYEGSFNTYEVASKDFISSTQIRKVVCNGYTSSPELRAGVIQGSSNRYPTNYVTVDIAILDSLKNPTKILLGRKQFEDKFRFIGGFSEPTSECLEEDAMREVREEATDCLDDNVKVVTFPQYICSMRIKDWRYRGLEDQICTTFFKCEWIYGESVAHDDIIETKWFDLNGFIHPEGYSPLGEPYKVDNIVSGHSTLMKRLLKNLGM